MSEDLGDLQQYLPIAMALSEWSNTRAWETRHPNNQHHWLLVAAAVCSDDPTITEPITARVRTMTDGAFARVFKAEMSAWDSGDWNDDTEYSQEDLECTHCGGDGSCEDGADPLGNCPDESHSCHACNGSGKRRDQTIF